MITLLKLVAAAGIAWGVLNPSFAPAAKDCECKGSANTGTTYSPLRAADCSCKGNTRSTHLMPRSDADCSCKAKT